ncbi:MAG: hypothetical protein ACQESE_03255 [Nanobdellota archaeon]
MTQQFNLQLHEEFLTGKHAGELVKWKIDYLKSPIIGVNGLNGEYFFELQPNSNVKKHFLNHLLINGKAKLTTIENARKILTHEFNSYASTILEHDQEHSQNIISSEIERLNNHPDLQGISEFEERPQDTIALHRSNETVIKAAYLFRNHYDLERRLDSIESATSMINRFHAATINLPEFQSKYFAVEIIPYSSISNNNSYLLFKTDKNTSKFPVYSYVKNNLLNGSLSGLKNILPEHLRKEQFIVQDFNVTTLPDSKDYVNVYETIQPKKLS